MDNAPPRPPPAPSPKPAKDNRSPPPGTVIVYLLFLIVGTPLLAAGLGALGTRIGPQLDDSTVDLANKGAWLVLAVYVLWAWISAFYYAKHAGLRLVVVVLPPVLAVVAFPGIHGHGVRAKVAEAVNWSNPHRTALGIACSEGALVPGMNQTTLGLKPAGRYRSRFTRSITLSVETHERSTVTIELQAISGDGWPIPARAIRAGETIVYEGTCSAGEMTWTVHGTAPKKYWPKL